MSKNSLILVLQNKQENSTIDMAKIHIKSEKLTPFRGIFSIYFCGGSCTQGCHYSFDEPSLTSSDTSYL